MNATPIIAAVSVRTPEQIFYCASTAVPDAIIKIRYHAATDRDIPYLFYGITCGDFEALDAALTEDPSIRGPVVVADHGEQRVYRVEPTPSFMLVPELSRRGGALLEGYCRDGAWHSRLQFPNREALAGLRAHCDEQGVEFEVRQLFRADDPGEWGDVGLTDAQREALTVAFEAGYFEDPREASLEDLGGTLGVSSTAVGRRLRRGLSRLVDTVVVGNP